MVIYDNLTNTQQTSEYIYTYIYVNMLNIYIERRKGSLPCPQILFSRGDLAVSLLGTFPKTVLCKCKHVCNSPAQFCSYK